MLAGLFTPSAAGAADFYTLSQARVELRDVVKAYGDHRVLNGVSLTVEPGEVVTILGPSGSGKWGSLPRNLPSPEFPTPFFSASFLAVIRGFHP